VQHDLPGVGENLQDHLQIRACSVQGVKTLNTLANSLWGKASHRVWSTCCAAAAP
jgi:choline dehydrogenase